MGQRAFWAAFFNKFCTLPLTDGQVKYIFELHNWVKFFGREDFLGN